MPHVDLTLFDTSRFTDLPPGKTPPIIAADTIEQIFGAAYAQRPVHPERHGTLRTALTKIREETTGEVELTHREFELVRGVLLDNPLPGANHHLALSLYRMFEILP